MKPSGGPMKIQRVVRTLFLALLVASPAAWAEVPGGDFARLSSQYAGWAGGKANADALIGGLRSGAPVTLVTASRGSAVSMAGFTPAAPMTYGEVRSALAAARQTLARFGIANPTAEEIQAALIGGDVTLRNGASRSVAGVIGPRGTAPVAMR